MVEPEDPKAPIVQSLEVDLEPAAAFERFAVRFGDWWPVLTHSLARTEGTRCEIELHSGGRVVEHAPGGEEHLWGSVTQVEPGRRLCFTWHPGREPESAQWVEVLFEPAGPGSRVTLTHGGWEALGEIAPILRQEYVPGWRYVFGECFGTFAREPM
jgi:uncharacterized protein YndB with AHSA1/START domain